MHANQIHCRPIVATAPSQLTDGYSRKSGKRCAYFDSLVHELSGRGVARAYHVPAPTRVDDTYQAARVSAALAQKQIGIQKPKVIYFSRGRKESWKAVVSAATRRIPTFSAFVIDVADVHAATSLAPASADAAHLVYGMRSYLTVNKSGTRISKSNVRTSLNENWRGEYWDFAGESEENVMRVSRPHQDYRYRLGGQMLVAILNGQRNATMKETVCYPSDDVWHTMYEVMDEDYALLFTITSSNDVRMNAVMYVKVESDRFKGVAEKWSIFDSDESSGFLLRYPVGFPRRQEAFFASAILLFDYMKVRGSDDEFAAAAAIAD